MNISISSTTTLAQIQQQFSQRFPYLKIEFFIDENGDNVLTANEMIRNHRLPLADVAKNKLTESIEIHGSNAVFELEMLFCKGLGIDAQVFHKRGQNWIATTTTDGVTLDVLNEKAAQNNIPLKKAEIVEATDRMDVE